MTLTKVDAGQESSPKALQPYDLTNLKGTAGHKLSVLIVIADASGAVPAGLDYNVQHEWISAAYASSCSTDPKLMRGPSLTIAILLSLSGKGGGD